MTAKAKPKRSSASRGTRRERQEVARRAARQTKRIRIGLLGLVLVGAAVLTVSRRRGAIQYRARRRGGRVRCDAALAAVA